MIIYAVIHPIYVFLHYFTLSGFKINIPNINSFSSFTIYIFCVNIILNHVFMSTIFFILYISI